MSILSNAFGWVTKGVGALAGGWQAYAAAAALGAIIAGGAIFELQQWRLGKAIAEGQAQFAIYRAGVAAAAAQASEHARTTETALRAQTDALDSQHAKEMENVATQNAGYGARLAARTLVLSVPARPADRGGGLSKAGAAALLDDVAPGRIELPEETARSLLAIGDDADRDAVKLRACQDYARATFGALE